MITGKSITEKSNTRITLALDIIKKLDSGEFSGYHEVNIIKQEIELHDVITIEDSDDVKVSCNNHNVPLDGNNLVVKVVDLLKTELNIKKNVKITIEKNIPVRGGLAGGSANAATVFKMLNQFWNLNLSTEQLMNFSRKIGMDVPFYFVGSTAFDTESTGTLNKINSSLSGKSIIIVTPTFGISTKDAYQSIDYTIIGKNKEKTKEMIKAIEDNNLNSIISNMHNDFEDIAFRLKPQLKNIKQDILDAGATNALLSGSGSALFSIIEESDKVAQIYDKLKEKHTTILTKAK